MKNFGRFAFGNSYSPEAWASGDIINAFGRVVERNSRKGTVSVRDSYFLERLGDSNNYPRVHKILDEEVSPLTVQKFRQTTHDLIERYIGKKLVFLFDHETSLQRIVLPLHNPSHWAAASIDLIKEEILIMDTMADVDAIDSVHTGEVS